MTATTAQTQPVRGFVAWVAASDHKSLGVRLFAVCGFFFVSGGVLALLMRSELARPGMQIFSHQEYNELFTMHGSTMVFLVMQPLAVALGVYLVPLQIGAADTYAPRVALFAFWLLVGGGCLMYLGFLTQGGAGAAGWTAFLPLSSDRYTPGQGMDMWVLGVALANLAALLLAAVVLLTILLRRAPGMTMLRLPPFCWTTVVTCLLVIFSYPAVILAMGLIYADRHFGLHVDPDVYLQLFWYYGHPAVYVMFFPFLGCVAEVIPAFSRKRFFGYTAFIFSLVGFTVLSMSVWGHHMFTTGRSANEYFSATSTALLVVAGVEYFDLLGTMWGGSIELATPMLFAIGFLVQFLVGGLTGIVLASAPLDYSLNDTYFVVAHFHYTLFAGSLFGLFAGVYYWFPKVTGALLREGLGRLHFWSMVVGTSVTFLPMFVLGYDGMVRRVADYPSNPGYTTLNEVSTVGAGIIGVSVAVFALNVLVSLRDRRAAGPDPWQGHSLEWSTSSPPPRHNFDEIPPIRSFAPMLDAAMHDTQP